MLGMVYEVLARKLFLAPTIWAYDMSDSFMERYLCWSRIRSSKGVHIRADFI